MTETEKVVQNYWGKTKASLKIARLPEALIGIQIGVRSCKPHTDHNFFNTNAYCGWTYCFVAFFLAAESKPGIQVSFLWLQLPELSGEKSSKNLENEALGGREQIIVKFYNFHTACDGNNGLNCTLKKHLFSINGD